MQLELFWAFLIIFTIDSIAPGPAIAMVMSRGASVGLSRTLPLIAGLVIGDLLLFLMALVGLVTLVKSLGSLFFLVKWIGIFYILYLAYTMWTAKPTKAESIKIKGTGWRTFVIAIFLPLGNPKAVGFYVALLPAFMDVERLSILTASYFSLAIVVIWSLVLIFYAALANQGRKRIGVDLAQKWLNKCSAGAMFGVAGTIAFRD